MIQAGVREVKEHLSQYLDKVRHGNWVTITEHQNPIAFLLPIPKQSSVAMEFARLLQSGCVLGSGIKPKGKIHRSPAKKNNSLSSAILEDRG